MRPSSILAMAAAVALLPACTSLRVNTDSPFPDMENPEVFDGYINLDGISEYDGDIITLNLFHPSEKKGELIHVGFWPIASVGVGLLGFRAQILPLDFGVGTFLYSPSKATGEEEMVEEPMEEGAAE